MSRLRTERLTIALCPDRVAIAQSTGWRRPKTALRAEIEVHPSLEGPLWQPGIDALARWLEDTTLPKVRVSVVLSNSFVRFAVVPWSEHVTRHEEEATLSRACFESQYDDMTDWVIQSDEGGYRESRIACAIESALLAALQRLLDNKNITCVSVQPYFVACWNRARRTLGSRDALIAVFESDTAMLAMLKQRQWHSLRAVRTKGAPDALQRLLMREPLLQGWAEPVQAYVDAPGQGTLVSDDRFHWLQSAESGSAAKSMAIIGACP